MTIKTQNGKVITKDGKVSCECCEEPPPPGECCLYPARAFVEGLYTVGDLPDEIIVTNDSFNLFDKLFTKTEGGESLYEATQGDFLYSVKTKIFFTLTGEERIIWALTDGSGETGLSSAPDCLIVDEEEVNPSRDQFADTYTVTWNFIGIDVPPASVVVTRESLCVWRGTDPCGNVIFLYYGDSVEIGGGLDYTWNLRLNNYVDGCGNPDFLNYIINKDRDAPSFQNSPVGYYPEIFATDATVS
jgi:hypothetical protein